MGAKNFNSLETTRIARPKVCRNEKPIHDFSRTVRIFKCITIRSDKKAIDNSDSVRNRNFKVLILSH